MATTAEDVAYIKTRVSEFCLGIVAVSKAAEPAYSNAANGFFRDNLVKDQRVLDAIKPADRPLSGDAQALFDIYQTFGSEIIAAFVANENHHSDPIQDPKILFDIENILADIARIIGELIAIYGGDPASKTAGIAALKEDIKKLIEDIQSKTAILEGTNANGLISKGVHDASAKASAAVGGRQWDAETKNIAGILKGSADELAKLKTDGHDPWLNPEWQVRFEGIMSSVVLALT